MKDDVLTEFCQLSSVQLGLPALAQQVQVVWNSRMRTTAGRAWYPHQIIELNPKIKVFGEEQMWRTLKHELAHLIAHSRAGRKRIEPHGNEWRFACMQLGIAGEKACHNLPFQKAIVPRKYLYQCPNCLIQIHRVRKIKRKSACAICCKKYSNGMFDRRFILFEIKQASE